jgi:hypothetical protein
MQNEKISSIFFKRNVMSDGEARESKARILAFLGSERKCIRLARKC